MRLSCTLAGMSELNSGGRLVAPAKIANLPHADSAACVAKLILKAHRVPVYQECEYGPYYDPYRHACSSVLHPDSPVSTFPYQAQTLHLTISSHTIAVIFCFGALGAAFTAFIATLGQSSKAMSECACSNLHSCRTANRDAHYDYHSI